MSRIIRELYVEPEQAKQLLARLEQLSGNNGIDIVLATELASTLKQTFIELKLDPKDTSLKELYAALLARLNRDETSFVDELSLTTTSEQEFVDKLSFRLNQVFSTKMLLVPKRSVVKSILKKLPPKNALKLLHYRSLDSALRRCPESVLMAACELTESKKWLISFNEAIDRLKSNDFEKRAIEYSSVDDKKWRMLHAKLISRSGHSVYRVNVAGGIIIVPSSHELKPGVASLTLAACISATQKLRIHSSFTVRVLLDESVPTSISEHLNDLDQGSLVIRSVHFGWQDLHHHLVESSRSLALFEPHITESDIEGDSFGQLLNNVTKAYGWWLSRLAVGYNEGSITVSCNIYDMARNLAFSREFGQHTLVAMRREIDHLIRSRYLKNDILQSRIYDMLNAASNFGTSADFNDI